MNLRGLFLLAIALVAAGMAALLAKVWLDGQRRGAPAISAAPAPAPAPVVTRILVAARPLPVGAFLRPEDLRWQSWPDEMAPPTYLRQGARALADYAGAVVRQRIAEGEPILQEKLALPNMRGFLAAVLQPGRRAVSLAVSPTSGVAGLVHPGDHVDVILTVAVAAGVGPPRRASESILRDIRVIAVDQRLEGKPGEPIIGRTATLEVTAKQAETLALAAEMGQLHLALRSLPGSDIAAEDEAPRPTYDREISAAVAALRGQPARRAVAPTPEPDDAFTVLRGGGGRPARRGGGGSGGASSPSPAPAPPAGDGGGQDLLRGLNLGQGASTGNRPAAASAPRTGAEAAAEQAGSLLRSILN